MTAVTLGWLWLGQHLSPAQFLGAVIVLGSIWAGQVRTGWAWQLPPGSSRCRGTEEQGALVAWHEHLDRNFDVEYFDWVGRRGIFAFVPDGNTARLVTKDPGWTGAVDPSFEKPVR